MGRRFVIVVLGNHLRDLLFSLFLFGSLVEYHPIIAKDLSRIHTIWKESFIWIVLRIRSVRGVNMEGWRIDCRFWGVGNDGCIGTLLEKTQCERGDISPKRRIYFFQSQMDVSKHPEEIRNWEHPSWYGLVSFKEIVTLIFLENQKGLFPQLSRFIFLDAGEAMNDFWCMSGSFKTAITLRLVWSLDRFHMNQSIRRKSSWRIYVVRWEIQSYGSQWESMRSWRKSIKWSEERILLDNARKLRGIYFIDPEDKEFKETIKNARKKLETSVVLAMLCKMMKNCGSGASNKIKTIGVHSGSQWIHQNACGEFWTT